MRPGTVLHGRYEVVRELGIGGAGSTVLVRDTKRDETLALKVLRGSARDPELEPLFRNEFLLLTGVDHPGVVGVRDFGTLENGELFFTMEFVPGESGRSFVSQDRLDADDYLDLAAGVLEALGHVHARGIVHRDIKPENVIIRRGDGSLQAVLIDFGLALSAGARGAGEVSGTLPYIAPEAIVGGGSGPRADLYSLGMVLFELATGKHPGSPRELLRSPGKLLAPDRVRRVMRRSSRGGVPRHFEDVVSRLMAPTPAERYRSAADALHALADLYGESFASGVVEARERRGLGELPLVGRAPALEALLQRVEALCEGGLLAPLLVVAGRSGIGTTRLLATLRNQAAVLGCDVCSGGSLEDLAKDVTTHPRMADGGGPGQTPREQVFRMDAAVHRLPADRHPVLILDEVHRMTAAEAAALRDWIQALEKREGRARLFLVIGGCTDGDGPGVELLRTAGGAVPHELRDLPPLGPNDIRTALGTLLGVRRVDGEAVQMLHRATEGHPRLLDELARLLVDEGVLVPGAAEPSFDLDRLRKLELPASVTEAARRRLERLEAGLREAVVRLAVAGVPLSFEAAREVAGTHLDEALEQGLLVRDRGRVRFASELTRRGADTLEPEARRKLAGSVAGSLCRAAPGIAAGLYAAAGDSERALATGLPVVRELNANRRHEEACALLARIADSDDSTGDVAALFMRVLFDAGRFQEASDIGLRLLDAGRAEPEVALLATSALNNAGRIGEALEVVDRIDVTADALLEVRVRNARASLLGLAKRHDDALRESQRAEERAGSLFALDGRVARVRANLLRGVERTRAAMRVEQALIDAPPGAVGEALRVAALVNRISMRLDLGGRTRDLLREMRRGLRIAREAGSRGNESRLRYMLASQLVTLGRPQRVAGVLGPAIAYFERAGDEEGTARALLLQADALLAAGRPGEADQRLARIEQLPGALRSPRLQSAVALFRAARAHLAGRYELAGETLHELLDRAGPDGADPEAAVADACIAALVEEPDVAERAWRTALGHVWRSRARDLIPRIRVGLSDCAGARGAWHLAVRLLGRRAYAQFTWRTPLAARALLIRAAAALGRHETALAGRCIERAVEAVNRGSDAAATAEVYATAASLLEEPDLQRYLRQPTASASAALLEAAREIWLGYGNENMLRKIDLHLAELPRPTADPLGGPDADRLVRVLHITREMNREFDRDRLLGLILDRAIELTGAERGFVILLKEGREEVHIARNIDREAISEPERKISSQIIREVVRTGRIVRSEDAELDQRFEDYLSVRQLHLKSIIAVPFRSGARTIGALYLDNRFRTGTFAEPDERLLELFADQAVAAIDKASLVRELEGKREELEELYRRQKAELREQNRALRHAKRELTQHRRARGWGFDKIVARSVSMQGIVREARRVADSSVPVLLTGENGTGKEMLARAVHLGSRRQSMPFVAVNCAAFAEGLLEAELFGHVRGSFTGADRDRAGMFEEADGGTLLLDEVGDMPLPMQVKLLRALELGEIRRVGESVVRTVDVRIVAATNAELELLIRNGRFREDLYYRLSGFVLRIPPLRERLEDVEPLAYLFVEEAARREGRPELTISNDAIAKLEGYSWSGNVRELRNVILRAVVTAEGDRIRPEDIRFDTRAATILPGFEPEQADRVLDEVVREGIDLNARQQSAVGRVLTRGKLTFSEYQQLFRISKSTTARDLEGLVAPGLLEKRGKTRAVVYLPGPLLHSIAKKRGSA